MTLDPPFVELDVQEKILVIEAMGQTIQEDQVPEFERILRKVSLSTTLNITNWTIPALKSLLLAGQEANVILSLRRENRYYTVVRYPNAPLLDSLITSIMQE